VYEVLSTKLTSVDEAARHFAAAPTPESHSGRPVTVTQGKTRVEGILCFMHWDGRYREVTVDFPDGSTEHFDAKDGPIEVRERVSALSLRRSFEPGEAGAFLMSLAAPRDERAARIYF
jgi:hypothetical protein